MFKKFFIAVCFCTFVTNVTTSAHEGIEKIKMVEDSLLLTADSMYNAFLPDDRPMYTQRFVKQLLNALKEPNSWAYDFPKLQEEINIIYPEDKSFRIFNWVIAPDMNTRRYYGAIQLPGEELKLFPLIDMSLGINKCEQDTVLRNSQWYGGIIYKIMPHEVDGQKVYTLFTYNGASPLSNKKVMDPMILTNKGPVFGMPIFDVPSTCAPGQPIKRYVMEYKKDVQASMNWDNDYSAIVFDHLVSQSNDPNRKYTYVPSGEYDGFRWKGNKWSFVKNLIPIDVRENGEAPVPSPIFSDKDTE